MRKNLSGRSSPYFALTDAATIAVDANNGNRQSVTLSTSRTMGNPTNAVNGAQIVFRIKQSGSGNCLITWSSDYRFSTSLPSPTLSTGANKVDYIGFEYNAADGKWDCLAQNIGFG